MQLSEGIRHIKTCNCWPFLLPDLCDFYEHCYQSFLLIKMFWISAASLLPLWRAEQDSNLRPPGYESGFCRFTVYFYVNNCRKICSNM